MVSVEHCQVKISTDPMEGHWKFQGVGGGGSQKPKVLKESVKLNLNFLWGWGGGGWLGGTQPKKPSMGGWIFSGTTLAFFD